MIKRTFALALDQGRRALARANYQAAVAALREAAQEDPGNRQVDALLRQAQVGDALQKAESQAKRADYASALQQVEIALAIAPDNEQATQLAATYKKAMQEAQAKADLARREQAAIQREQHARKYFEQRMRTTLNSRLFDEQEIKVKGSLVDVEVKVVRALTNREPGFKLVAEEHPDADTFFLQAKQSLKLAGWRRCDLVGGQTRDGEVTLFFKVFEYAYPREINLVSLITGTIEDKNMVPIHPSRIPSNKAYLLKRREEGIALVRERIRGATGE